MLDYHLIRFAGREEHRQAIVAFDSVRASRVVLPDHFMVVTGEHIKALHGADVAFAYITPAKSKGQDSIAVEP